MKDYIVTVRAVVRARAVDENAAANPAGWVVHESAMDGDMTVIECDTLVEVRAETDKGAVERAKARVPAIEKTGRHPLFFSIVHCNSWRRAHVTTLAQQ
jgi:hypothetical protein